MLEEQVEIETIKLIQQVFEELKEDIYFRLCKMEKNLEIMKKMSEDRLNDVLQKMEKEAQK